jgi:hypothetical protein
MKLTRYAITFRQLKPDCPYFDPCVIRYDIEREPCSHEDHETERAIKGSPGWTYHPCCEKYCPILAKLEKVGE